MDTYEMTEALKQKLENANSMDELVKAFHEEGIPVTAELLKKVADGASDDDLSEEDLDAVAGGRWISIMMFVFRHGVYIGRLVKKYIS